MPRVPTKAAIERHRRMGWLYGRVLRHLLCECPPRRAFSQTLPATAWWEGVQQGYSACPEVTRAQYLSAMRERREIAKFRAPGDDEGSE